MFAPKHRLWVQFRTFGSQMYSRSMFENINKLCNSRNATDCRVCFRNVKYNSKTQTRYR